MKRILAVSVVALLGVSACAPDELADPSNYEQALPNYTGSREAESSGSGAEPSVDASAEPSEGDASPSVQPSATDAPEADDSAAAEPSPSSSKSPKGASSKSPKPKKSGSPKASASESGGSKTKGDLTVADATQERSASKELTRVDFDLTEGSDMNFQPALREASSDTVYVVVECKGDGGAIDVVVGDISFSYECDKSGIPTEAKATGDLVPKGNPEIKLKAVPDGAVGSVRVYDGD